MAKPYTKTLRKIMRRSERRRESQEEKHKAQVAYFELHPEKKPLKIDMTKRNLRQDTPFTPEIHDENGLYPENNNNQDQEILQFEPKEGGERNITVGLEAWQLQNQAKIKELQIEKEALLRGGQRKERR